MGNGTGKRGSSCRKSAECPLPPNLGVTALNSHQELQATRGDALWYDTRFDIPTAMQLRFVEILVIFWMGPSKGLFSRYCLSSYYYLMSKIMTPLDTSRHYFGHFKTPLSLGDLQIHKQVEVGGCASRIAPSWELGKCASLLLSQQDPKT